MYKTDCKNTHLFIIYKKNEFFLKLSTATANLQSPDVRSVVWQSMVRDTSPDYVSIEATLLPCILKHNRLNLLTLTVGSIKKFSRYFLSLL